MHDDGESLPDKFHFEDEDNQMVPAADSGSNGTSRMRESWRIFRILKRKMMLSMKDLDVLLVDEACRLEHHRLLQHWISDALTRPLTLQVSRKGHGRRDDWRQVP